MRARSLFDAYRSNIEFNASLSHEWLQLQASMVSLHTDILRGMMHQMRLSQDRLLHGLDSLSHPFYALRQGAVPPAGPSFTDGYGKRAGDINPEKV